MIKWHVGRKQRPGLREKGGKPCAKGALPQPWKNREELMGDCQRSATEAPGKLTRVFTSTSQPHDLLHLFIYLFIYISIYLTVWGLIVWHTGSSTFLAACGIFSCALWVLVSWPGIELESPALGAWGLSHWTTREVPPPHDLISYLWYILSLILNNELQGVNAIIPILKMKKAKIMPTWWALSSRPHTHT